MTGKPKRNWSSDELRSLPGVNRILGGSQTVARKHSLLEKINIAHFILDGGSAMKAAIAFDLPYGRTAMATQDVARKCAMLASMKGEPMDPRFSELTVGHMRANRDFWKTHFALLQQAVDALDLSAATGIALPEFSHNEQRDLEDLLTQATLLRLKLAEVERTIQAICKNRYGAETPVCIDEHGFYSLAALGAGVVAPTPAGEVAT